jgi:Fe2+ or Zn2+ uptake regulation protein
MSDKLTKEIEAFGLLQRLLQQADEVRKYFIAAGLPLPGPLSRLLGEAETPVTSSQDIPARKRVIHPPAKRPETAKDDWIAIRVEGLTSQDLALAFLRDAAGPMTPKALYERVDKIKHGILPGTIYNIGSRLISRGDLIKNEDSGEWHLPDPSQAPLMEGEYAWGPREVFSPQALASHRRDRILSILTESPDGLTTMQIAKTIESEGVPASKEVVMNDMDELQTKGVVRRSGRHHKWSLVDDETED